ncbi:Chondroitin sulfate proteoglycan 5, partial [Ophiophagus hannah]
MWAVFPPPPQLPKLLRSTLLCAKNNNDNVPNLGSQSPRLDGDQPIGSQRVAISEFPFLQRSWEQPGRFLLHLFLLFFWGGTCSQMQMSCVPHPASCTTSPPMHDPDTPSLLLLSLEELSPFFPQRDIRAQPEQMVHCLTKGQCVCICGVQGAVHHGERGVPGKIPALGMGVGNEGQRSAEREQSRLGWEDAWFPRSSLGGEGDWRGGGKMAFKRLVCQGELFGASDGLNAKLEGEKTHGCFRQLSVLPREKLLKVFCYKGGLRGGVRKEKPPGIYPSHKAKGSNGEAQLTTDVIEWLPNCGVERNTKREKNGKERRKKEGRKERKREESEKKERVRKRRKKRKKEKEKRKEKGRREKEKREGGRSRENEIKRERKEGRKEKGKRKTREKGRRKEERRERKKKKKRKKGGEKRFALEWLAFCTCSEALSSPCETRLAQESASLELTILLLYRTPSELHNDNFSLSTIAEGSHPNVRKFCDTPCNHSPHARALAYYDNIICQHASCHLSPPLRLPVLSPLSQACSDWLLLLLVHPLGCCTLRESIWRIHLGCHLGGCTLSGSIWVAIWEAAPSMDRSGVATAERLGHEMSVKKLPSSESTKDLTLLLLLLPSNPDATLSFQPQATNIVFYQYGHPPTPGEEPVEGGHLELGEHPVPAEISQQSVFGPNSVTPLESCPVVSGLMGPCMTLDHEQHSTPLSLCMFSCWRFLFSPDLHKQSISLQSWVQGKKLGLPKQHPTEFLLSSQEACLGFSLFGQYSTALAIASDSGAILGILH